MFNPFLKSIVCVGGPCHGEFVDGKRPRFECHINTSYKNLYKEECIAVPTQTYLRTNYERTQICADLGNLHIEGWAFVWHELCNEQHMMEMVWAMLIASNLKPSVAAKRAY